MEERLGKNGYWAKIGDTIEVVKGRKYPKGTKMVVASEWDFRDLYGRVQCHYLIAFDGRKVDAKNVVITRLVGA